MAKEEFIDLLDFTGEKPLHDEDESLSTVIRDEETSHLEEKELIGQKKVIQEDDFTISLYKKEHYIDMIEIECKCGKKTTINLEYEGGEEAAESHLSGDIPGDSEESETGGAHADLREDLGEEYSGFQAGIPAESVNTEPKIDAVKPQDKEEQDSSDSEVS
jgi:hypothetical protein